MKLEDIEGVGPAAAKKLRGAGVGSTASLLAKGATAKGRKEIAAGAGVAEKSILEWVNRCDLMRVKGVSTQYSDLLEAVGVDSPTELAQRNAKALAQKCAEVNAKGRQRIVRRVPPEKVVADWIAQAKKLPKVVKH